MAQMSLHYLYNQKIIFLHMDVKERTDDLHFRANLRLFYCVTFSLLLIEKWWAWLDSNQRPHAYQACALTN